MTDNELLLAISQIMDKKLKPIQEEIRDLKLTNENEILPRLQNIENCYTTTYKRYSQGIECLDTIQADLEIMKKVITEHSEKLQKTS